MNTATIPSPWTETTEESFQYAMDVLPPIMIHGLTAFMVSEPQSHCPTTGRGIFSGYAEIAKEGHPPRYFTCDATVAQFRIHYADLRKALA
jgi:hypothetical protein